jgi:TrmH family RNA methyltransferase
MRRTITGFSNPTVKLLKSLRDKKHRRREGLFLAEGLRLLTDAREMGRMPQMLVMAQGRDPHPLLAALEADVLAAGGEVLETSEDILSKITGKDNPQAVCGVFAEFDTSLAVIDRAASPIWLVAQAMRDPGNLGTMLRTGDAVGAGGLILLDDSVDPFRWKRCAPAWGRSSRKSWRWPGGTNSCPGCVRGPGNWSPPACARRCPIAGRPMPGPASSWWAMNRADCQRTMKWPATCASPCR